MSTRKSLENLYIRLTLTETRSKGLALSHGNEWTRPLIGSSCVPEQKVVKAAPCITSAWLACLQIPHHLSGAGENNGKMRSATSCMQPGPENCTLHLPVRPSHTTTGGVVCG